MKNLFEFAISSALQVAASQQVNDPKVRKVVTRMTLVEIANELKEKVEESKVSTTTK